MNNADYWRGRFSILEDTAHREAQQTIQAMEEMYLDAQRSVQKEIESWYSRFAVNNQISLSDARKWLTTGQLEEFHWTVEQYIKIGEQAGLDAAWLKKLENASTRFHISRLEAVQTGIQQQIELLYGNQVDDLDALLKKIVGNGYTRTAFEVQKGVGLGWDITGLNQKKLETLLSKPWTTDGRTFRDRCWLNKNDLVGSISKNLTQGLLRGDSPAKITTAVQKQFGVHRYKAARLINTETTYFNAVATKESYKALGVENVEIIETLDSSTCPTCQGLDGKVIPLTQYEPGVTIPPFHPNCRGTTAPAIDPKYAGERAARNEDGTVYYVPANMTYPQWKKAFVNGGFKTGLTVAAGDSIIETGILKKPVDSDDEHYKNCVRIFEDAGVKYNPVRSHTEAISEEDIIKALAGADKTSGSCASVGMAYVGQKHGLDVRDFRGGKSMESFRSWTQLEELIQMKGMNVFRANGASSLTVGNRLLKQVEVGKEYYLVTGQHASIVRKTSDGILQYLELQANYRQEAAYFRAGWTNFDKNVKVTLSNRFGCNSKSNPWHEKLDFMVDVTDSAFDTDEFKSIMGYINTNIGEEQKGLGGGIK